MITGEKNTVQLFLKNVRVFIRHANPKKYWSDEYPKTVQRPFLRALPMAGYRSYFPTNLMF